MQPSMFNLRVPLPARGEVFLMNTLSDAQLIVSPDVSALLDRVAARAERANVEDTDERAAYNDEERSALESLAEHGFLVTNRESERTALDGYFDRIRTDTSQLGVTVQPDAEYRLASLPVSTRI